MTTVLRSLDRLMEEVSKHRLIVVEGARCVGKNTLIGQIRERDPSYRVYEYLQPRKDYVDSRGSLKIPPGFEIQQSFFWVFDFLRQQEDLKVICNRSLISSLYWDQYSEERFLTWQSMLARLEGLVVFVEPLFSDHRRRLSSENRSHELNAVIQERRSMNGFAHEIDKALVVWYQG